MAVIIPLGAKLATIVKCRQGITGAIGALALPRDRLDVHRQLTYLRRCLEKHAGLNSELALLSAIRV